MTPFFYHYGQGVPLPHTFFLKSSNTHTLRSHPFSGENVDFPIITPQTAIRDHLCTP